MQDAEGFVIADGVLTDYKGSAAEITIPSTVREIGAGAFRDKSALTGVTIPSTVTKIGSGAFWNCWNLESVSIAEGVTEIGASAFYSCTKLVSITIPKSMTGIEASVFELCSSLAEVNLSESVTSIGARAFFDCGALQGISFPSGLTEIGEKAFCHSGLTDVTIPSQVTAIGLRAFAASDGYGSSYSDAHLKRVTVEDGVTAIGEGMFAGQGKLESLSLSASLKKIGGYAFYNCRGLTGISFPSGLTEIGASAFSGCSGLKGISIPDGVTSVGNGMFADCANLVSVALPSVVTEIGNSAFSGCGSLSSIRLPEGVTRIGGAAFKNCGKLVSLKIPASVTGIGDEAFQSSGLISIVLPEGVTEIGSNAFYGCGSLVSVTVPEGVTEIAPYTFYCCPKLTTVKLPNSLTGIGDSAFYGCTGIRGVTVPDQVESIGDSAFSGCSGMTDISLSSGLKSIGIYAFYNCGSLKNVLLPEGVTEIGEGGFKDCSGMTGVALSSAMQSIQRYTFDGCGSLVEVTVPSGVETIGEYAFQNCAALKKVTIELGVKNIEEYAFYQCGALEGVVIPEGVLSVGAYAFNGGKVGSAIKTVAIPSTVSAIGQYAFHNSGSMTDILVAEGNKTYESEDGCLYDKGKTTLIHCPGGKEEVAVSQAVITIGGYAFSDCSNLMSVEIPENVQTIGKVAFSGSSLRRIRIAEGVTSIGEYAFSDCKDLIAISVPASVVSIGSGAFSNCNEALTIYAQEGSYVQEYVGTDIRLSLEGMPDAKKLSECTVTVSPEEFDYDGQAKEPAVAVKDGDIDLVQGTDYSVAYKDNKDAGTASAIVTGEGNYIGRKTVPFVIHPVRTPLTSEGIAIAVSPESFDYDGTAREPAVTVTDGGMTLTQGTDYELTYTDNIEPGTAKVTITGIGNYMGSVERTFEIRNAVIAPASVAIVPDQAELAIGGSLQMLATVSPANVEDVTFSWSTDREDIAKVTRDGLVTAVAEGVANVRVTLEGTELSADAQVTVIKKQGSVTPEDPDFRIEGGTLKEYTGTEKDVVIPAGVTSIGDRAFQNCTDVTSVTIPAGVKEIGNSAFMECISLKEVHLPMGLERIGDGAFSFCGSLTAITLPESVVSIGTHMLFGCESIISVTVPAGVEDIGIRAFAHCASLAEINVAEGNGAYVSVDGCLYDKGMTTLICCPGAKSAYTFPESVTVVGQNAFDGCGALTGIEIPADVEAIGAAAFLSCISLAEINVAEGNGAYVSVDGCLYDKGMTTLICCPGAKDAVDLPESVTKIGNDAFDNCRGLTSIALPAAVTEIGSYAFCECSGLTQITLSESLRRIGDLAFIDCVSLARVEIPFGVEELGIQVFDGCVSLKAAVIPESVTSIGRLAFQDCENVTIYGKEGSYAQAYAQENGVPFSSEGDISEDPKKDLSDCKVTLKLESLVYDGKAKEPAVTVTDGGLALTEGTDYTVEYRNNVEPGTASVILTGAGKYKGSVTRKFEILEEGEKDISECEVTLSEYTFVSDGSEKRPAVTVTDGDKTLQEDVDYDLSYEDNIDPGTATVTVYGKGVYGGEVTVEFTIEEGSWQDTKELYNCQVIVSPLVFAYDKMEKTPAVTVKDGSVTLTQGKDYTVEYDDNIDAGTAKAAVTGIGGYTGTVVRSFTIQKAVPVIDCDALYEAEEGEGSFDLDADLESAEGELSYSTSNSKVVTVSRSGTVNVKGPGVAAITISVGATENYEAVSVTAAVEVSPKKQKLSTIKALSGRKLKVSFRRNAKATGYIVQYSTDKKFKKNTKTMPRIKNNKKTSVTTPKLKKGKRYYVRVRSYKTVKVGGKDKTLYGEWSAKKNKKVKE